MSEQFDDIPQPEPLPSNAGEGFGVSENNLPVVKAADIVDQPIAILGYLIMENKYKENDVDADKVVLYEVMDATNSVFCFWHTSSVLKRQVVQRHEREEIPFRTVLEKVPSKKSGHQPYYSFA